MRPTIRSYIFAVAVIGLLAAVGVVGARGGALAPKDAGPRVRDSKAGLAAPTPVSNQIAYVTVDGHVAVLDLDDSTETRITAGDGFFAWPTWSPDGATLVYSGVTGARGQPLRVSLYSHAQNGPTREIFVNEPGVPSQLAVGVIHYANWSPDATKLAFIANTTEGLTLFLYDPLSSSQPVPVLRDGPLWMSWSPDSRHLLVHRGLDLFLVDTGGAIELTVLERGVAGYRTGAWNRVTGEVAFVSRDASSERALFVTDGSGAAGTKVANVGRVPAFLWSPDGAYVAVSNPDRVLLLGAVQLLVGREIELYPVGGAGPVLEVDDPNVAFFWSPDGTMLAYVTPAGRNGAMRWMVMDIEDGETRSLIDFLPSGDQLIMFQFFDQYAYSHSLWSPDGRSLVFAGAIAPGAMSVSTAQQQSRIFVLDVELSGTVEAVAEGFLAVWASR